MSNSGTLSSWGGSGQIENKYSPNRMNTSSLMKQKATFKNTSSPFLNNDLNPSGQKSHRPKKNFQHSPIQKIIPVKKKQQPQGQQVKMSTFYMDGVYQNVGTNRFNLRQNSIHVHANVQNNKGGLPDPAEFGFRLSNNFQKYIKKEPSHMH